MKNYFKNVWLLNRDFFQALIPVPFAVWIKFQGLVGRSLGRQKYLRIARRTSDKKLDSHAPPRRAVEQCK